MIGNIDWRDSEPIIVTLLIPIAIPVKSGLEQIANYVNFYPHHFLAKFH